MNDTMIIFGDEIKALGDGKVAGFLVTFGDPKHTDISKYKDFFTNETDYDADFSTEVKSSVYYNHGLDKTIGKQKLGDGAKATLTMTPEGIWAEAQLNMANKYEAIIYKMVSGKKMGWSSGTVSHLVEREKMGEAHWIKKWSIGLDASLTPIPADFRNKAIAIKSLDEFEKEQDIFDSDFVTGDGLSISKHIKAVLLQVEILNERLDGSMKMGAMFSKVNKAGMNSIASNLRTHAQTLEDMANAKEENSESAQEEQAENDKKKALEEKELLELTETKNLANELEMSLLEEELNREEIYI